MRILFATDGSVSANRARDLLDGINLPSDSLIRVVGVRRHLTRQVAATTEDHLAILLDSTVGILAAPGRRVERVLLEGHPGSAIADEAREMGADLIVLGNRGHGTLGSMLLGSVSRHVVAHAPCSVLIARSQRFRSVLLATDGSADARLAECTLTTWPMFRGSTVRVISVAQTSMPTAIGGVAGLYDQVMEQYEEDVDAARHEATDEAEATAARLTAAGVSAIAETREGDPAGEIVQAAVAHDSDLVVTGTHGRTGLSRLLLGSVAGNVAGHSTASVLVVRGEMS